MLVAALGFAIMGALVKVGAQKFSSAELVFYRSIFGLVTIWAYILLNKLPLTSPVLNKQISRALVGFASLVLFFYAIAHLPLATAITLNYTSPLFLAVLTPLLLHEKLKKTLVITLLLGFIGAVILLKPVFTQQDWLAGCIGLLSGMGAAWAYVHVKQLGKLNEPDWRTVFYFTLISTIGAGCWVLFQPFTAISIQDLPVLLGLGFFATIAQLAMTRAYRTGNTLVVASLAYTTIVLASLLGALYWQEYLNIESIMAIALIALSGIISVRTSTQNK